MTKKNNVDLLDFYQAVLGGYNDFGEFEETANIEALEILKAEAFESLDADRKQVFLLHFNENHSFKSIGEDLFSGYVSPYAKAKRLYERSRRRMAAYLRQNGYYDAMSKGESIEVLRAKKAADELRLEMNASYHLNSVDAGGVKEMSFFTRKTRNAERNADSRALDRLKFPELTDSEIRRLWDLQGHATNMFRVFSNFDFTLVTKLLALNEEEIKRLALMFTNLIKNYEIRAKEKGHEPFLEILDRWKRELNEFDRLVENHHKDLENRLLSEKKILEKKLRKIDAELAKLQ